jgi:hypothetical protein
MSLKTFIEDLCGKNDGCEFRYVNGIKCKGYKDDSITCTRDDGIGCGIRKEIIKPHDNPCSEDDEQCP